MHPDKHLPPHKCSESHTSLALARVTTPDCTGAAGSSNEALTKQKAPITTFAVLRFGGRYSSAHRRPLQLIAVQVS